MAMKIQKVEIQLSANVVTKNDSITLSANLSDLEWAQLQEEGVRLEFAVDDETDDISPHATNPLAATWKVPNSQDPGEFPVTVALVSDRDQPRLIGRTKVHVIAIPVTRPPRAMALDIDPEAGVEEGEPFKLAVLHGP
jgi:hypothetical protein